MHEIPTQKEQALNTEAHEEQLHTVHYLGSMPREVVADLLGHGEKGHTDGSELEMNDLLRGSAGTAELASLYFDATKFSAQYFDAPIEKQISIIRDGLLDELFESLEALSGQGSKPDISEGGDILWFVSGYLRMFGLRLEDVDLADGAQSSSTPVDERRAKEFADMYLQARQQNAENRLEDFVKDADEENIDLNKLNKLESKVAGVKGSREFVDSIDLGSKPRGAHQDTSPSYAQVFDLMKRFGESKLWNAAQEYTTENTAGVSPLEQVLSNNPELRDEVLSLAGDTVNLVQDITGYDVDTIAAVNMIKTHGRQHIRDKDPTAHRVDAVSQVGLDNKEGDGSFEETNIVELIESNDGMVDIYVHEGRTDERRSGGLGELSPATRRMLGEATLDTLLS